MYSTNTTLRQECKNMNKKWTIIKALIYLFTIMFCVILIYMVVDFGGDAKDILSLYHVVDGSKSEFPKQLQFMKEYIRVTGDITIALNTGMTPEEIEQIMDDEDSGWDDEDDDDEKGNKVPIPSDLDDLIFMSFEDALKVCMNDSNADYSKLKVFNSYSQNYLNNVKNTQATTITVNVWHWKSRSANSTNLEKVSATERITVNKAIAPLLEAVMTEIYSDPSKPVLYNSGCWNVRSMRGSDRTSGHAFGCAVDLNASSSCGSYTNQQSGSAPFCSKSSWSSLPECQAKYEVFYDESPVVIAFKRYGFQWGGDWSTGSRDGMHFSFIGDNGERAREIGQDNARKYR